MKVNKIAAISLLSTVALTSLAGCGGDAKKLMIDGKEVLFKIGETAYFAEDNWSALKNTTTGINVAYEAIRKAVIQTSFPPTDSLKAAVDLEVDQWEVNVRQQAAEYGYSYTELRDATLDGMGLKDMVELRDYYQYELQKTRIGTKFYNDNREAFAQEWLSQASPYHVRHILLSLSDTSISLYNDTITETEAKTFASTLGRLAQGTLETQYFRVVAASNANGDSTARNAQGDLGIMDEYTGFVSEFKLGVYAYETYTAPLANQAAIKANFGIPASLDAYYEDGFTAVPLSVFTLLGQVADITKDGSNADLTLENYPRNKLFNYYFNKRVVQFIEVDSTDLTNVPYVEVDFIAGQPSTKILTDNNNNPILMIRSQFGVHLVVLEKSPYAADAVNYFTKLLDSDANYTTYVELDPAAHESEVDGRIKNFLNYGYGSGTTAAEQKFTDYRLYEHYLAASDIEIADATLAANVTTLIANSRNYKQAQINDSIYVTWANYVRSLEREIEVATRGQLPDVTGIGN